MRIQVYDVDYVTSSGTPFNGFVGLYHDGRMIVLAPSFGGHGLMSGWYIAAHSTSHSRAEAARTVHTLVGFVLWTES